MSENCFQLSMLYSPVKRNLFLLSVYSDMEGDFDQFEEVDDDFLGSLNLDFDYQTSQKFSTSSDQLVAEVEDTCFEKGKPY